MFHNFNNNLIEDLRRLQFKNNMLYAGYPSFMEIFGRDSIITGMQLYKKNSNILKNYLNELIKLQGNVHNEKTCEENGKIIHEYMYPSSEKKYNIDWVEPGIPLYYSVDSTPLFVIAAQFYYKRSSNITFKRILKNAIIKAVQYLIKSTNKYGFLFYNSEPIKNKLATMGWMDGSWNVYSQLKGNISLVEIQGYIYQALKGFISIFQNNEIADKALEILNILNNNFIEKFYNTDNKYFYPALECDDLKTINEVTSNAGHLLFTDIINKKLKMEIVKRLFSKDMITEYGIRTLSTESKYFDPYDYQYGSIWPHDNWIIYTGLKSSGFDRYAEVLKEKIINGYNALEKQSYEYYSVNVNGNIIPVEKLKVKPCNPQAWSAGTYINLLYD